MFVASTVSRTEKADIYADLAQFFEIGGDLEYVEPAGVTVAFMPAFEGATVCAVAVSVAHPKEPEFVREVGIRNALFKMEIGECISLPVPNRKEFAMQIAMAICRF